MGEVSAADTMPNKPKKEKVSVDYGGNVEPLPVERGGTAALEAGSDLMKLSG